MQWNRTTFVGKIKGLPNITVGPNGEKQATFILVVIDRQREGDQWVDKAVEAPMFTMDSRKVDNIIAKIKPNQELLIEAQYVNWQGPAGIQQHGFRLISLSFGYAPRSDYDGGQRGALPNM